MKQIQLTQGKVALVNDEDFEYLNQFKWYAVKNYRTYYAVRQGNKSNGKQYIIWMHREIMNPEESLCVDHIDMDGLNNQRTNLRIVTIAENMQNQRLRINNTTGFKGISWEKDRSSWRVNIMVDKKLKMIGRFKDIDDAIKARVDAVRKFHPFETIPV